MEFIFSDDRSTDQTYEEILAAIGGDSLGRAIKVLRTPENYGLNRHLAFAVEQAAGEILIFQAGDDVAYPRRVSELVKIFESDSRAKMVMSNVRVIDANGCVLKATYAPVGTIYDKDPRGLARGGFPWLVGASEAIRREVFFNFGPSPYPACWEDYMLAFRASLLGHIVFCNQLLLDWRHHGSNMSHFTDFSGSSESQGRYRTQFIKNLKSHVVYLRQHMIDLRKAQAWLEPALFQELEQIVSDAKCIKQMEYAARRRASWRVMWALCLHNRVRKQNKLWILRQFVIRVFTDLYFKAVYEKIRTQIRS